MQLKHSSSPAHFFFLLMTLASLLCFSSCGHYFYAPSENSLLELQEKGDLKAGGTIGGGWQSNDSRRRNFNGQIAYSPINNFGIQASGTFWRDKRIVEQEDYWAGATNSNFMDLALGHYWIVNKNHPSAANGVKIIWDHYGGFGSGSIRHLGHKGAGYDLDFHKFFLQTHLSISIKNRISFGLFIRPTWVNYRNADVYGPLPPYVSDNIELLSKTSAPLFVESGFNIQGGWEKTKLYFSTRLSRSNSVKPNTTPNDLGVIPHIPITASVGVVFDLRKILQKE